MLKKQDEGANWT